MDAPLTVRAESDEARAFVTERLQALSFLVGSSAPAVEKTGGARTPGTAVSVVPSSYGPIEVLVDDPVSVDTAVDLDLQRALMRLKPDQRVAVVLVHAHGHSYADAASLMDIPVTTVTNHVTRGLARLRQFLEDS